MRILVAGINIRHIAASASRAGLPVGSPKTGNAPSRRMPRPMRSPTLSGLSAGNKISTVSPGSRVTAMTAWKHSKVSAMSASEGIFWISGDRRSTARGSWPRSGWSGVCKIWDCSCWSWARRSRSRRACAW